MNEDSAPHFLVVTSALDGAEMRLRSPALPTLHIELSDLDRADEVRVDIVLSDGTAYFGMMPRKTAASLQGITVDYGEEPVSIEMATIAGEAG